MCVLNCIYMYKCSVSAVSWCMFSIIDTVSDTRSDDLWTETDLWRSWNRPCPGCDGSAELFPACFLTVDMYNEGHVDTSHFFFFLAEGLHPLLGLFHECVDIGRLLRSWQVVHPRTLKPSTDTNTVLLSMIIASVQLQVWLLIVPDETDDSWVVYRLQDDIFRPGCGNQDCAVINHRLL